MAKPSVTLRNIKGAPLSWAEGDANFTSLQEASVPDGGTTGQVLTKSSNSNYDYTWQSLQSVQSINLQSVGLNILPTTDLAYDLGSPTKRWRSLYVGAQTIYLDQYAVSVSSGQLTIDGSTQIGPPGSQGIQGIQGTQGIQGIAGSQGVQGLQGLDGAQGTTGAQGQQGLQGVQGTQGILGSSTNLFDYKIDTQTSTGDPGQGLVNYAIGQYRAPITMTKYGNGVLNLSTTEKKFGTTSAYFNYNVYPGGHIITSNIPAIGTGPFTIEFWYYKTANDGQSIFSLNGLMATLYQNDYNIIGNIVIDNGGEHNFRTGFNHVAIVRTGTTKTVYINGVNRGTETDTTNYGAAPLYIGRRSDDERYITGYLDEFRISNIARYTTAFTPSTSAFTPDNNDLFLCHFDGTDGSTTFVDSIPATSQIDATQLNINKTTFRGQVVTNYLKLLVLGTKFLIQDKSNVSNYQIWRMTGSAIDQGTYLSLPVSVVSHNAVGTTGFAHDTLIDFGLELSLQGVQGAQGTQGVQGAQGLQGVSGPATNITGTQPGVASVGDQWFDPSTQILKIYTASGWVQVGADDLTF